MVLQVFFVPIETLGLRRFGGQADSSVFYDKNELSKGKFGYHIGAPDI